MKNWAYFSLLICIIISCETSNSKEKEIENIPVTVNYALFHKDFFRSDIDDLSTLKNKYPYMFPENVTDEFVLKRRQNTIQQDIFKEVELVYSDFNTQKATLLNLFKHVKFYYPDFVVPKVVTDITGLSYRDRVLYYNNLLLISLDLYLGKEHEFYASFPGYIKEQLSEEGMLVDVAKRIINTKFGVNSDRTFLGKIIFEGKKLYLLDLFLPKISQSTKMGYTAQKMDWADNNQAGVWSYFVKNDLLYSNQLKLSKRFIDLAPFSKFYTAKDKETPGSIGKYMGLQIVKAFVKNNNNISLQQLLITDAQAILNKSKFKPTK